MLVFIAPLAQLRDIGYIVFLGKRGQSKAAQLLVP